MKDRTHFKLAACMRNENDHIGLFEDDYMPACLRMRYEWGLPSKCPSCGVWSHHRTERGRKKPIVRCPLCDHAYNAEKYHLEAIKKLSRCLRKRFL